MKIQVVTNDGKVVDSYEGVDVGDVDDVVFGPAIHTWLRRTLAKAGEVNKEFSIHAADRTMEAAQREEKSQDEIDNTVRDVVVEIWSDQQERWLVYSRDTDAAVRRFWNTLMHSNSPTRKYRAIADWGNGEVLWNMRDEIQETNHSEPIDDTTEGARHE